MFRRRRHEDEESAEHLEVTDEEELDAADSEEAEAAAAGSASGPWDVDESAPDMERIDFGALQVPIGPGIEVQVNLEATEVDEEGNPVSGRPVAVTVVHGDSGLQLQAFAAPKRAGIWDEVRKETAGEIEQAGGQTQNASGPFGPELRAMVPIQIPEEVMDQVPEEVREQGFAWQPLRFLGVDGPRWFLRGVVSGAAIEDEEQWQVLEDVFRNVIVVRGEQPMPPRELLELTLPADAEEVADEGSADDSGDQDFNPFQRGPEITEVR
ncbi:MAG TPA: DUF3710 domain-containing protein [Streptosporangiaceae bacterium]|nr:DUF3710 domain-containing protein [Streptosporangiaceae bacterium]